MGPQRAVSNELPQGDKDRQTGVLIRRVNLSFYHFREGEREGTKKEREEERKEGNKETREEKRKEGKKGGR